MNSIPGVKKTNKTMIIVYAVLAILALYLSAALGAAFDLSADRNGKINVELVADNAVYAFSNPGIVFTALQTGGSYAPRMLFVAGAAIGIFALYKYSKPKKKLHRKGVEHGSAKWGDEKEKQSLQARECIKKNGETTWGAIKEAEFKPFMTADGQRVFDEHGDYVGVMIDENIILTEDVLLAINTRQHFTNLHVLVIGGSGSGKTWRFAKPNILQLNTSFIVTDPKGEILESVGELLIKAGYEVRVFNTYEMQHSNNYNPFHYVYDYDGNLDSKKVASMIQMFMDNTKGDGEKEDFWSASGRALLETIVLLLFDESEYYSELSDESREMVVGYLDEAVENGKLEKEAADRFKKLPNLFMTDVVEILASINENLSHLPDFIIIKPETRDFSSLNFFSVTEKMRKLMYPPHGKEDGYFMARLDDESDEDYKNRRYAAFLCELDKDYIELERRKGETLAVQKYKMTRKQPQETGLSIASTAGVRIQPFDLKKLCDMTCCDNIHLETIGDKKTALFVIIPPSDPTFNFLAAMLYSQMFDTLSERANFKYANQGKTLPVHVRCIMDEFANIGEIPRFTNHLAYVRSMGISINIIIQNMAQLKARYEKEWESITGNCDSLLFLGGKEAGTLKEISEMLGKETIDVESRNRTTTGGHKNDSTAESNSIMGRELMFPDEIGKMDTADCILMIRAHNPFYCRKYSMNKHPNYRFSKEYDDANGFDLKTVKVKTLREFAAENKSGVENGSRFRVKQIETVAESAEPGSSGVKLTKENPVEKPEKSSINKLEKRVYPPKDEKIEVEFDTYADMAEFANDIAEGFADGFAEEFAKENYDISTDLSGFDMPYEPDENYRRDESDYEFKEDKVNDNYIGFVNENFELQEEPRKYDKFTEENIYESESYWANQKETPSEAYVNGSTDDFAMDF